MASVKLPSNVTSITVGGSALTPVSNKVAPANDAHATILVHHTTRPKFKQAAANGDITITFPSIVTSVTIGGTVYTPNGSGDITVPAAVGTAYLNELKYALY
jgi:hypothetical protein